MRARSERGGTAAGARSRCRHSRNPALEHAPVPLFFVALTFAVTSTRCFVVLAARALP